jgi:hypothetical protein
MNCLRCNGLAVIDDSFAVRTGSSSDFHGWRCVNCGMIVDDVIRDNRRVMSQARRAAYRERRRYGHEAA